MAQLSLNMTDTPWTRYESRIQAVIDHIHQHPAGPVDNDTLAEVACLSSYHWHRIFRAITGETSAQSVRRVRMHLAASELVRTPKSIVEIGQAVGYPTVQSFTRVFKAYYGQSPGLFRSNFQEPVSPSQSSSEDLQHFDVEIIDQPAMRLIGVWHTGDYLAIGQSFERVLAAAAIAGMPTVDSICVGVYLQDPSSVAENTELQSFAGVWVPDHATAPSELEEYCLPSGHYAALTFQGPYALLEQPYLWLFSKWLPASGKEISDRPGHEIYLNNPRTTTPNNLLTKICFPLD